VRRRVVVTGLGLVTPVGNTVAESWSALVAGKSGAARIQRFDPTPLDVTFGCEVKGFDPLAYLEKKEAKRCDLFAQYGITRERPVIGMQATAATATMPAARAYSTRS
jgi:3-oxoacyl-[acyl-carrier-protein] synthase II